MRRALLAFALIAAAIGGCATLNPTLVAAGQTFQCVSEDDKLSLVLTDRPKVREWLNSLKLRTKLFRDQIASGDAPAAVKTAEEVLGEVDEVIDRVYGCV